MLKNIFGYLTLRCHSVRRSVVNSGRGTARDEPQMFLRHPPLSMFVQSPAVCNESHEVYHAVPRIAFT
jgi:hypothetical protein